MARTRDPIWRVGATLNSFTVKKIDYLLVEKIMLCSNSGWRARVFVRTERLRDQIGMLRASASKSGG